MSDPTDPRTESSVAEKQPEASKEVSTETEPIAAKEAPKDGLAEALAEVATTKDKLLRVAADFDNFRKRARRDVDDAEKRAKENLLKDLLPVFDNLERAVTHAETAADTKSVAEGISMVARQFVDTLSRSGIDRVKSKGESFDPSVHEAISQIESDEEPGTILTEVQPGYRLGDRLLRAAMVVVAKPRAS